MYITQQEMVDRFGEQELIQLTDRGTTPAGIVNAQVLAAAVTDAEAEINGYLQSRYALPLTTVPLLVTKLTAEIARYNLYDDQPTDPIIARHDAAIKTLVSIAKGVVHLGMDQAGQETPATASPATVADTPVFSVGGLANFTNPNQLYP